MRILTHQVKSEILVFQGIKELSNICKRYVPEKPFKCQILECYIYLYQEKSG